MARLRSTPAAYDLILDYGESDQVGVMLDRTKSRTNPDGRAEVVSRFVPVRRGDSADIQVDEWTWSNGKAGSGWGRETPASHQEGGSSYGEFVNLRRLGVAQPAGRLTELTLPTVTRAMVGGDFIRGQSFGAANDLYLTTRHRTIVKVHQGTGESGLSELDLGSGHVTGGVAIFSGTGTSHLYVSDTQGGIHELNDATQTWSVGEEGIESDGSDGTSRGYLEVPFWTLGNAAATGGLLGTGGTGAHRLVGIEPHGDGFYHVAGDPKVAANWSALERAGIGGSGYPIRSTVANNRTVWVGTGLGVLGVDGLGHSANLTKWVELIGNTNNTRSIAFWAGMVWFATEQGLFAFTPDGSRVDLGRNLNFGARTGQTPIYGRPRAMAPSEDGLYVAYYNEQTTTSYVGILILDDDGSYRWSMAEAVIHDEEVTYVQQVSGHDGTPRLFIGTVDEAGLLHLYTQSVPRSGDPEIDALYGGPFVAAETWNLTLSQWDAFDPNKKVNRRFIIESAYLGADYPGNTIEFQLAQDDGAFTFQGTAAENRWSGTPVTGSVQATSQQVKLVVHNSSAEPVVIRSVGVRYSPRPELTKVRAYDLIFGENVLLRNGHLDERNPGTVLTRVEQFQRGDVIDVLDHFGRHLECLVEIGFSALESEEVQGDGWTVRGQITLSTTRNLARFDVDSWDLCVFA